MEIQITLVVDEHLLAQADSLAHRLALTRSAVWQVAMVDFLDDDGEAPRPDEGSAEE